MNINYETQVAAYLKEYGSITPADAYDSFGCMRLAAVVFDMKKKGYPIFDEWETGLNRWGKQTRYKRYYVRPDGGEDIQ